MKHFRKAIKLVRLFKSPAVVANFQIFSITISRSSIIHTLYNWSLIVTSLDLLTIRFRSLKLKLCNQLCDNLNRIRIRLSIHRFFLSSRVNYNIFLFYPNACLFEWFLVRWQKKKSKSCKSITDIRTDSYKRYGDDKLVKIARFSPSGGEEFFQFSVLTFPFERVRFIFNTRRLNQSCEKFQKLALFQ